MKLSFFGAAGCVTGSKFLLEKGGRRVLFDCGLFQGIKKIRERNWQPLPFDPASLDAIVLTHAHLDHTGYLPVLVRDGYQGPILCTPATAALAEILLADSGRIQEEDAKFANKRGHSRHKPAKPLYTEADARNAIALLETREFDTPFEAGGLELTYRRAGHILGAATVTASVGGVRVLFSGDLGRNSDLLHDPPTPAGDADWIVMESTYGDRVRRRQDPIAALAPVVERALRKRGTLLIPSFAVGRAQTMLYCLYRLFSEGTVPQMPVYVDSPMATDVTRVYRRYERDHKLDREETAKALGLAQFVASPKESKRLSASNRPKVIISASGMATAGRVLHHLKAFVGHARNTVLLPSFQAPGTRGAALAGGADSIKIHGRHYGVRAEVEQVDLFSAHADREELLEWLAPAPESVRRVFLVHGEPEPADELRREIEERQERNVYVPDYRESVELD